MDVIEDSRKVLQDFLAPELRAIAVRLDALEKRLDDRFAEAERTTNVRFDAVDRRLGEFNKRMDSLERQTEAVDRRAEARHQEVMSAIRQVLDLNAIQQRLARLESKQTAHQ